MRMMGFQDRCLKPLGHPSGGICQRRPERVSSVQAISAKLSNFASNALLAPRGAVMCAANAVKAQRGAWAKWHRVKWSVHYRVHLAQFRHILTMLKFDSSLGGMGDDAGSGKLGAKTVRVACGLRAARHFLG
jgi:hypothetical protein